jgi:magnesium-transporting ATPase (P-type)
MEKNVTQRDWYKLTTDETLLACATQLEGLNPDEVSKRQVEYGFNKLPERKKVRLIEVILRQFFSPLIYVLVVAAVISFVLKEYADTVFILIILLVNALIGTIQEWKAETSAEALQQMIKIQARVVRNGKSVTVNADQLVPGDILLLESGNKVPADIRLLDVNNLLVEEALLTGESMAIAKFSHEIKENISSAGDKLNMAFAGTIVTSGRAKGVVIGTGTNTEIGRIAEKIQKMHSNKAPLVARMEQFAKKISIIVLVACILLGVGGYLTGIDPEQIFFFVVAIAVSAIPEGLPIAMTVALSIGTARMSRRHVIIRKLTAVEGLGSCTMISTDKTGTLTVDQQTVRQLLLANGELIEITGQGYNGDGSIEHSEGNKLSYKESELIRPIIDAVVICNEGKLSWENDEWKHQGDAVDVALLALAFKADSSPAECLHGIEIVKEIPFESERKYAAVYYRKNGELHIAVKGAAEVLLNASEHISEELVQQAEGLAEKGFRYIAVAGGMVENILEVHQLPPLKIIGFVALIDPPRQEVKASIEACHAAGIDVCMITGDHPGTAMAIARDLNIAQDAAELITGATLAEIQDVNSDEFASMVKGKRVFARVSPQQKQAIVAAQQRNGHFVAVTGDGVNDAPALKTANIGVAMGYGTDVAKEVSSIIVTDNNFSSIVAGVEEGRFTYGNIRKIIYLLISTGAAELLMIGMSLAFMTPLPFLPAQILWLNLVTNGIQDKALAVEKGEKEMMQEPPRNPKEGIFNRQMIAQVLVSSATIALLSFGLWYHLLYNLEWDEAQARNATLLLMVLLQNFHLFNCRSEYKSVFRISLKDNRWLIVAVLLAQGVHVLSMHIPFMQNLLHIEPIALIDWLKLFSTAAIIVLAMEIFKLLHKRKQVGLND